ncbi:ABC transporter ATP-binding protein [Arundinibacter roseus]|uniref:ABC transporter ATP-binding protein n=1 Tax=Arundinibacter roseus TaxID=2070510 RepID=A0A4R4KL44_9BACT|nr:ABC transporter ATP-binding protein [Arundinibacter roseus]TDB69057.1 ABC transporter ATP-binding protein [Arundinibacter roseus]
MLTLQDVSFGYNKRRLLFDRLSMQLEPGSIYGLLGKNGAGKSSLMRCMAGLLFPLNGNIDINGHAPKNREPAFLQDIFFIPEEPYLPNLTIDKFVKTRAPFFPQFDDALFLHYLSECEIPTAGKLSELSFGQKKKVLISFALATNVRIVLMDEPTNGLDIPSKSQFRRMVSHALQPDRLILISTHQLRDLENLIDYVLILHEHKMVMQHSLQEISERLHFGVRPSLDEHVLYSEPSLQGYKTVRVNLHQEESRVEFEALFQAVVAQPERIQTLFQNPMLQPVQK